MKNLQKIRDQFVELAIEWGDAFTTGDHRTANRRNSAVTKIANKFKDDENLGTAILVPLFTHPNPSVRLFASIHALDQNIEIGRAESILTQMAADSSIRLLPLMAEINLSNWHKKKNTDQKDEPAG
jgi:hypothetical protein